MNKHLIASAALALGAGVITTAVHAQAVAGTVIGDAAAPAAAAPPGHHAGHGGRHLPFLHALKQLDLSETQKASIHQILDARRSTARAEHTGFRERIRAFAALDPGAADYQQQVNGFADEAAARARQRTQEMAQLKAQVIAVLTPGQKAQFLAALANPPLHAQPMPAG